MTEVFADTFYWVALTDEKDPWHGRATTGGTMSEGSKRAPLAERLILSLREGIEFARQERHLRTTLVPVARSYSGADVTAIRNRRRLSQADFARLLAVNVKTLQSWEQGVRRPSKPTMRLLQIFDDPDAFQSMLFVNPERSGDEPPNGRKGAGRPTVARQEE